jgi:hypothetical protein
LARGVATRSGVEEEERAMRITKERALMSLTFAAAVLALMLGAGAVRAAELDNVTLSGEAGEQTLKVVRASAVIAGGMKIGTVVLYDDPSTSRSADYLELYDGEGGLVAVSWFDRFGIQRVAVDRGFVDGRHKLEGVFVAVVDGEFI